MALVASTNSPLPKRTMLVVRENGRLYQVDFTENPELNDPTLIDWEVSLSKALFGKFQLTRGRAVTLEQLEFENVSHTGQSPEDGVPDLEVTVFKSLDGRNMLEPIPVYTSIDSGGLLKCNLRATGENFAVQLRGTYNISTLIFTTHNHGRR